VLQLAVTEKSTVLLWLEGGHSAISTVSSFTTGQPFCSSLVEALHCLDWNKVKQLFYPTFFPNEAKSARNLHPTLLHTLAPTISVISSYCAFNHSTISDEY